MTTRKPLPPIRIEQLRERGAVDRWWRVSCRVCSRPPRGAWISSRASWALALAYGLKHLHEKHGIGSGK